MHEAPRVGVPVDRPGRLDHLDVDVGAVGSRRPVQLLVVRQLAEGLVGVRVGGSVLSRRTSAPLARRRPAATPGRGHADRARRPAPARRRRGGRSAAAGPSDAARDRLTRGRSVVHPRHPDAAEPGHDLVVDGADRLGPVVGGRLAVGAAAEQRRPRRRRPPRRRRSRARTGPCRPGRRSSGAGRPSCTGPTLEACRGHPVGVPERHQRPGWSPGRWCRCGRTRRPAGRHPLGQHHPGARGHRRAQPEALARRPATGRRRRCPGGPGRSGCPGGSAWRPSWPGAGNGGRTPARSATASPSRKTASCRSVVGWPGASAYTKWLHTPTTSTRPSACAFAAASTSAGQSATVAPPRDSPVSILRCTRAGRSARRRGRDHLVELRQAGAAEVDAGGDPVVQRQARGEQPGQHRRGDAGPAQRQRLVQGADAEPGRAPRRAPPGRPGTMPWP